MKYYVMKEESRTSRNNEVRVIYNPSKALMVCDDIVAANKYFEFCVSKKRGRFALFAESVTHPCRLGGLSQLFNNGVVCSGNCGFEEIRSCSIYRNQQSGKYDIVETTSSWLISVRGNEMVIKMTMMDFYGGGNKPLDRGFKIEGMIMDHRDANGETSKRLYRITSPKVSMRPFEQICDVHEVDLQ